MTVKKLYHRVLSSLPKSNDGPSAKGLARGKSSFLPLEGTTFVNAHHNQGKSSLPFGWNGTTSVSAPHSQGKSPLPLRVGGTNGTFSAPLHLICDNLKGDGCHDTRIVKPLNSHASHGGNYISIIVTVNWVNQMFVIPSPK